MSHEIELVRLTGRKAVVALAVLALAWLGYTAFVHHVATQHLDEARDALRLDRVTRQASGVLQGVDLARDAVPTPSQLDALVAATHVTVQRMEMRGGLTGRQVFRVTYEGDAKPVYVSMGYSFLTGWVTYELLPSHPVLFSLAPWRWARETP